ncbi:membrane protein [Agaricicola taiwanensis]|uniref:Protoporphyrinogen IX oxidase n=1 Tax=Agaricicola taiwanensis TaxID=591372 RepID=A0A8J3DYT2_9RHOB|nr:CopD family protein [Agaricicola taiwanensis]GGE50734.1 membrane protein [Agaricicola taiwanensis]
MTLVWLKLAHIAALVVWCGGLLLLPSLFAERGRLPKGPDLWRLQRYARHAYTQLICPAAFVAVATGIGLVFYQEVFTTWFALKLAFVGLLVGFHMRHGFLILNVFDEDRRYARWRSRFATAITTVIIAAILWIVLAKPPIAYQVPDWLRPGGLQSLSETMMPMP